MVNEVSVVLYKTLKVSNTEITFWTSWLALVWAFKALWSPLVDGVSTRRRWTLAMQLAMVPTTVLIAFALPTPWFFQATLALFLVLSFLSATHDIAADGLYMLGLNQARQAAFVGVRSTFWRLALMSGQGILVVVAGRLGSTMGVVEGWSTTFLVIAALFGVAVVFHLFALPAPAEDQTRPTPRGAGQHLRDRAQLLRQARHRVLDPVPGAVPGRRGAHGQARQPVPAGSDRGRAAWA